METQPVVLPTCSVSDAALFAEMDAVLRGRLARDPELRRLVELLAVWLAGCVARSKPEVQVETAAADAQAAEPTAPPPTPAVSMVSDNGSRTVAVGPDTRVDTSSAEHTMPPPADASQLAALLSKFSGESVSPVISPVPTLSAELVQPRRKTVAELEPLARRMDLNADACLWAIRRYDELPANDFEPLKGEYEQLRSRAGTMQPCFLWMIHQDAQFIGRDDWIRLEGCYRACAEVLRTIVEFPDAYHKEPDLLKLLGEAQSAIRAGMTACGAYPQWVDHEQQQVFDWCRLEGEFRSVYNPFLSLDRLADPSLHGGMLARVRKLNDDLKRRQNSTKDRRRGLKTIQYHIDQLKDGDDNVHHHWTRIAEGIEMVLGSGAPPSLPELVDALVPVADDVPESVLTHQGIPQLMMFVDQRIAADEAGDQQPVLPTRNTTSEVLQVREALRGSRVVLIGGEQRSHSKEMLEREFELAALEWPSSAEHQSISSFEAVIARPDTKLVLLMIRWASHSFEGVQEICRRYGKVFVRLPGGYNPSQVAHQIVAQVSSQLGIDFVKT